MSKVTEIVTDRLYLRQWRDADRKTFSELCSDPEVMKFLLPLADANAIDATIDGWAQHIALYGWGFWAVELRELREFIGFIGIQRPRLIYPFSPCVEIAWRLSARHWGFGYATEGASVALTLAFEHIGLPEVVSFCALDNKRSREVMERLGMTAHSQFEHPAMPQNHPLRAQWLYKITATDWQSSGQHKRLTFFEKEQSLVTHIPDSSLATDDGTGGHG